MNLRAVGKIGFLLVVIGFLMPIACDQNGFELAKYFINEGDEEIIIGILMYLVFISAVVGIVLGVLLLQNKEVSKGFEWFCLIVCITSGLIVYFTQLEGGPKLQNGAYMILTGWIITFIFQIVPDSSFTNQNSSGNYSSTNTNNRSNSSSNKKCRQCGNIYPSSQYSCPNCNSSLYEEINESKKPTISIGPINKNYGDTWICKKCGEKNPLTSTSCRDCGEYK